VRKILDRRNKYIHRYNYGKHEIYDMESDPLEEHNPVLFTGVVMRGAFGVRCRPRTAQRFDGCVERC
ncbi:hypothetical protein, partial [Oceanibaculum sp.]|uniref:hypothetical protein n=1 Tax=Oceanibaculum sp. TaxID=1903597 RepID=UPI0025828AD0